MGARHKSGNSQKTGRKRRRVRGKHLAPWSSRQECPSDKFPPPCQVVRTEVGFMVLIRIKIFEMMVAAWPK